jgi:hypothetical protein
MTDQKQPKEQTVKLRGSGGAVWEFSLPLGDIYRKQIEQRRLTPADAASARLLTELGYLTGAIV